MIKKSITGIIGVLLLSSSAYGHGAINEKLPVVSDIDIKLKAFAGFEGGTGSQTNRKSSEYRPSSNRNDFALHSEAAITAEISKDHDDMKYGGKIVLTPMAKRKSNNDYNGSHIFAEGEYGRIELGSPIAAAKNMMISVGSLPSKYVTFKTEHMRQGKKSAPSFLTSTGCFISDVITADTDKAAHSSEPPRTINYYTPKFAMNEATKMQIGISYTPDTSNTGATSAESKSDGINEVSIGLDEADKFEIDRSLKDAVTAGILLEHELGTDNSLKLALTGEYGKSVGKGTKHFTEGDNERTTEHKLASLKSYNIGGELKLGDITYKGCYGSHGKSLTTPELHKSGRKSYYYGAGMSYKYDQFTTDLTYFGSEKYKNKLNSLQLKGTVTLAEGFKPYVSVTHFVAKGKPEYHSELKARKTRGTIFVAGTKISL